jgi:adenylyltransferase/sulfurtransferase
MKNISPLQLQERLLGAHPPLLIDIRESYEYSWSHIGGLNVPLSEIDLRIKEIPRIGDVVIHCKSGNRSQAAIDYLSKVYGYSNLINLEGGQEAWSLAIDSEKMPY